MWQAPKLRQFLHFFSWLWGALIAGVGGVRHDKEWDSKVIDTGRCKWYIEWYEGYKAGENASKSTPHFNRTEFQECRIFETYYEILSGARLVIIPAPFRSPHGFQLHLPFHHSAFNIRIPLYDPCECLPADSVRSSYLPHRAFVNTSNMSSPVILNGFSAWSPFIWQY